MCSSDLFAQELAAHKGKVVVLLLEVGVEYDHLGETQRQEVHGVDSGQLVEHAVSEARLPGEGDILRTVGHVQTAQKIQVFHRRSIFLLVGLEVLKIGLKQRPHMAHLSQEEMLSLHHTIDGVIQGCGRR